MNQYLSTKFQVMEKVNERNEQLLFYLVILVLFIIVLI